MMHNVMIQAPKLRFEVLTASGRSSNLSLLKFWFISFLQHMQPVSRFSMNALFSQSARLVGLAVAALSLSQCTSVKKADVVVSVKEQKLGLYEKGELKQTYRISTSKFGLGDKPGSNRTPLGQHQVVAKIGHGLPTGAVLKSRRWNGEVLKPNAPGRDPIVSRILWLKGTEPSNRHAFDRFIYIHGTPEEKNLGSPASYGCVRMGMRDVVSVFNSVNVGAKVFITKGELPRGEKPAGPGALADDGSPATTAPDAAKTDKPDEKAAESSDKAIEIAKIDSDSREKANAEKNLKEKAGPTKPAAKKSSSSKSRSVTKSSSTKKKTTSSTAPKVTKKVSSDQTNKA